LILPVLNKKCVCRCRQRSQKRSKLKSFVSKPNRAVVQLLHRVVALDWLIFGEGTMVTSVEMSPPPRSSSLRLGMIRKSLLLLLFIFIEMPALVVSTSSPTPSPSAAIGGSFYTNFTSQAQANLYMAADNGAYYTSGSRFCADPQHAAYNAPLAGSGSSAPSSLYSKGLVMTLNNTGTTCTSKDQVGTAHFSSLLDYTYGIQHTHKRTHTQTHTHTHTLIHNTYMHIHT